MKLETLHAVVEELNRRGIPAALEYPGFIQADINNVRLSGGDVNETFDIDIIEVMDMDEAVFETIESTIPSDSTDVEAIATHFACAYNEAKAAMEAQ